ncbi:MAG: molybdenum cofactor guanylyltransferase [Pseudomonadota bacterium]|jgi:molybdopterin-guanine dinucleotide biosynthesis protein A
MTSQTKVAGVILAGGRAQRMNFENKALMHYQGQPLIAYSFFAMRPIVDELLINTHSDDAIYHAWGAGVIADATANFSGPLAGVLAAMNAIDANTLMVVPCDAPFITTQQLNRLLLEHNTYQSDITVACCGEQVHSVFMVVNTALKANLEQYLARGERKVRRWFAEHQTHYVDFGDDVRGFENINTLEELHAIA